ncbi:MAG TPA: GTP cyclohydrolase II [Pyrinomonadaceae bacterium]|jgi:3,4-dihydroxy 2-butanone 4-phosphate synthase/GTP cyclohydrolase II
MALKLIHSNSRRGTRIAANSIQRVASTTVERVAEARLPTETGEFRIIGFRSLVATEEFVVLVKGELRRNRASLVRIHSQCMTGDVFGSIKCDCGRQLDAALKLIEQAGHGVIVYQQQEGRGIGIINKIRAYALQDEGADTIEANERLGFEADMRRYDQCAEILLDLGLCAVRVMSDNPAKIRALRQAGLDVIERVRLEIEPHDLFADYLKTKKEKMGHLVSVA